MHTHTHGFRPGEIKTACGPQTYKWVMLGGRLRGTAVMTLPVHRANVTSCGCCSHRQGPHW